MPPIKTQFVSIRNNSSSIFIHSFWWGERYPTEMIRELSKLEKVTGCYSSDQGIRILEGDVLVPAKFMDI